MLAQLSDGDARRALTALEVGVRSTAERPVRYYEPLERGYQAEIKRRMEELRRQRGIMGTIRDEVR